MVLFSFLENYNLESKTIIPFAQMKAVEWEVVKQTLEEFVKGAKSIRWLIYKRI